MNFFIPEVGITASVTFALSVTATWKIAKKKYANTSTGGAVPVVVSGTGHNVKINYFVAPRQSLANIETDTSQFEDDDDAGEKVE